MHIVANTILVEASTKFQHKLEKNKETQEDTIRSVYKEKIQVKRKKKI